MVGEIVKGPVDLEGDPMFFSKGLPISPLPPTFRGPKVEPPDGAKGRIFLGRASCGEMPLPAPSLPHFFRH